MTFSLEGKVVLVTGAGAGIGRAVAQQMALAGGHIAVCDINKLSAEETAHSIVGDGGKAVAITADVGDIEQIDRMVGEAATALGTVNVLVNNAGLTRSAYIMDLNEADWDRIQRVNAKGVFFCLQRTAKDMIAAGGGNIINMASISGRGFKDASNAIYATTKGGVIGLTRIAAHQLGKHNINVNAVCPGITRTALFDDIVETRAHSRGMSAEDLLQQIAAGIPIRRVNEPEDIAGLCVYLASDAARNITGQSFNIDGGLIMS